MNFKSKYLKYKSKYISITRNMKGGNPILEEVRNNAFKLQLNVDSSTIAKYKIKPDGKSDIPELSDYYFSVTPNKLNYDLYIVYIPEILLSVQNNVNKPPFNVTGDDILRYRITGDGRSIIPGLEKYHFNTKFKGLENGNTIFEFSIKEY